MSTSCIAEYLLSSIPQTVAATAERTRQMSGQSSASTTSAPGQAAYPPPSQGQYPAPAQAAYPQTQAVYPTAAPPSSAPPSIQEPHPPLPLTTPGPHPAPPPATPPPPQASLAPRPCWRVRRCPDAGGQPGGGHGAGRRRGQPGGDRHHGGDRGEAAGEGHGPHPGEEEARQDCARGSGHRRQHQAVCGQVQVCG